MKELETKNDILEKEKNKLEQEVKENEKKTDILERKVKRFDNLGGTQKLEKLKE